MFEPTLVIDCSGLCYSYAYTLDQLEIDDLEVGVVYGFLKQIRAFAKQFRTMDFVFCWDAKGSDRTVLFPEYKLKRKEKKKQDPILAKIYAAIHRQRNDLQNIIIPKLGFENSYSQNGKEADDIIADIVMGYENCIIISGDDDLLQLLPWATIWNPGKKLKTTTESFREEYGIDPDQWGMVKVLSGCKSDEVPGIPGVGIKTAISYLNGTLPNHHKVYRDITANKEAVIKRNTPLVILPMEGTKSVDLLTPKTKLNSSAFWEICKEYKFKSFMEGTERTKWELFLLGDL